MAYVQWDEADVEAWLESADGSWVESDDGLQDAPWFGAESAYHDALRAALAPEYRTLPTEQLDALVAGAFESLSPEEAEGLGDVLKGLARAVAPVAARALPALAPLAAKVLPAAAPIIGTVLGGPAGAAAVSALSQFAGQMIGGVAPPPGAPVMPSMAPAPAGAVAAPGGADAGGSAITQLLSLLKSPELLQSLLTQLLGNAGARAVPVGPEQVPATFGAFMNALSVLANQAASESVAWYGDATEAESGEYLRDDHGSYLYDPAVPEERAAALVAHLRAAEAERYGEDVGGWLLRAGMVSA
jgi:hypothetical protein